MKVTKYGRYSFYTEIDAQACNASYITDIKKSFLTLHHIFTQNTSKIDLSVMKNTFSTEWCFRAKKLFS